MPRLTSILLAITTLSLIGVTWLYVNVTQINRQLRSDIAGLEDQNSWLETDIESLGVTLRERQSRIQDLSEQLGITVEKVSELETTNSTLDQQNETLTEKMQSLKSEIDDTLSSLHGFENQISDSLAWFQANSSIEQLPEYADIRTSLVNNCLKIDSGTCEVRLSCLNYINEHESGLSYQSDYATTGKEDQIQSLPALLEHKGGDCEDFTQLAFAELNYLNAYCSAQGAPTVRYTAFEDAAGGKHYVENSETYYISDTRDIQVDPAARYFYPVCGSFPVGWDEPSLTSGTSYGHCLLGFSDRTVNASGDAPLFLQQAILIEPQSGKLVTDLRSSGIFSVPVTELSPNPYTLTMVITEHDLYSFNALKDRYQWRGYDDFASAVGDLSQRISALKN
ncbi:hypothetical protein AUK40_01815 [Candidatus Wirthbacteria bacterium CG2_30_54_11]|uniref:Transglutaminase-like domain-containing protein n=1 Tax=Candidatus Wirthbacteria bacterium CG2_30_54_11 TaxID=1817892 RepID=A0A1J5IM62_9BACT|nr:MAG: hypothetical protein AUK40_01815 [Candidatus Wirthbacteria bacterium CG2_30_54_11]